MQKNALPLGRAFGLLQPNCQGLFQHMTALFIIIAHFDIGSKKMIDLHDFCSNHSAQDFFHK